MRLLSEALPEMLTFVAQLERVQADLRSVLAPERQALLAWAWLRRKTLGWSAGEILAALPPSWRDAARVLLAAWADAVRVSTAVEIEVARARIPRHVGTPLEEQRGNPLLLEQEGEG